MANRRAERIEIASMEGMSRRADYLVHHSMAMLRYADNGRDNRST